MKNVKKLREEYLNLARTDKKLVDMEIRFNDLSETHFRINGKYDLMSIEDLMIVSYIKSKISNLVQANRKLNPFNELEASQFSQNSDKIKEYQDLMDKMCPKVQAENDLKHDLSNEKNTVFFSLDGSNLYITSVLMANGAVANQKETKLQNVTNSVNDLIHFKSETPLNTALSDASDLMFINFAMVNGNLKITGINVKTGKPRYYGVVATQVS